MHGQLQFWVTLTQVDLMAKITAEKAAGAEVFYHFCNRPLPMFRPPKRPT